MMRGGRERVQWKLSNSDPLDTGVLISKVS